MYLVNVVCVVEERRSNNWGEKRREDSELRVIKSCGCVRKGRLEIRSGNCFLAENGGARGKNWGKKMKN